MLSAALLRGSSGFRRCLRRAAGPGPRGSLCLSTKSEPLGDVVPWEDLPYQGAFVDLTAGEGEGSGCAALSDADFLRALPSSVAAARAARMKSFWLRLPIARSGLAAEANEALGFEFHHAKGDTVTLKLWLQDGLEDKVPPFATHQVGVAGFVLNRRNEILTVKEFTGSEQKRAPSRQWKLPGGLLDLGESFEEGSVREVVEETGVRTRFDSLLCFWHRHGLQWGKSDMYVVCQLSLDGEDETITIDPDEISACRWMPVTEFIKTQNHPLILKVFDNVYGINPQNIDDDAVVERLQSPLRPSAEVRQDVVAWPGRKGYPTYFASCAAG